MRHHIHICALIYTDIAKYYMRICGQYSKYNIYMKIISGEHRVHISVIMLYFVYSVDLLLPHYMLALFVCSCTCAYIYDGMWRMMNATHTVKYSRSVLPPLLWYISRWILRNDNSEEISILYTWCVFGYAFEKRAKERERAVSERTNQVHKWCFIPDSNEYLCMNTFSINYIHSSFDGLIRASERNGRTNSEAAAARPPTGPVRQRRQQITVQCTPPHRIRRGSNNVKLSHLCPHSLCTYVYARIYAFECSSNSCLYYLLYIYVCICVCHIRTLLQHTHTHGYFVHMQACV